MIYRLMTRFYHHLRWLVQKKFLYNYIGSVGFRVHNAIGASKVKDGELVPATSALAVAQPQGEQLCAKPKCTRVVHPTSRFCLTHFGKRCLVEGCEKGSQGKAGYCCAHGGRQCIAPDCTRSAQCKSGYCVTHGGRRCAADNCTRSRQGRSRSDMTPAIKKYN